MSAAATRSLEIFCVFRGRMLEYRLLDRPELITVGPGRGATFPAPAAGWSARLPLLSGRRGRYVLRVAPGMRGSIRRAAGDVEPVETLLAGPTERRGLQKSGERETELLPGDEAQLTLDAAGELKLLLRFAPAPEHVPRRATDLEPFFVRIIAATGLPLGILALVLFLVYDGAPPPPTTTLTPERMAKLEELKPEPKAPSGGKKEEKKEDEGKAKKAKDDAGKLGLKDAPQKDTVLPKGREDVLREKVKQTGLLGVLGKSSGSGLNKLFNADTSAETDQALAGLVGAQVAVGRGSGGLSTAGSGSGGGGTGFGRIGGTGDIDTGGAGSRGRGKGPALGSRKEAEVKVSMSTGTGDSSGGLTKEQVDRVVKAHFAGVRYCFEKELQRAPKLAGQISITWLISPDGAVQRASVGSTTMNNAAVEGCIARQVKAWQFPKSDAPTNVTYPFIFRSGA